MRPLLLQALATCCWTLATLAQVGLRCMVCAVCVCVGGCTAIVGLCVGLLHGLRWGEAVVRTGAVSYAAVLRHRGKPHAEQLAGIAMLGEYLNWQCLLADMGAAACCRRACRCRRAPGRGCPVATAADVQAAHQRHAGGGRPDSGREPLPAAAHGAVDVQAGGGGPTGG